MLEVTVYPSLEDDEPIVQTVDFVSLVSDETYGPPALVAPSKGQPPTAKKDHVVLYLNTRYIPMFEIRRLD